MDTLLTPEYKVLNELFGRDTKYIIPEYQRPYSWDCIGKSDKNNQVNVMWDDLITYFEEKNPNPYFFGSMVLVGSSTNQEYQVIDGQQRLTTLTILFVAIKCFLINSKEKLSGNQQLEITRYIENAINLIDDIVFNKKIFGAVIQEKKVKIEKITGFDYDVVLKIAMECGEINKINLDNATEEQKAVSRRYFDNRRFFESQLSETFLVENQFTYEKASNLNEFIEFLKQKVAVVRILTSRFEVAYQIFEILNNRGLPLSNKDLFRNFIIKELNNLKISYSVKYSHIDPNQIWTELEDNYDLENEFISRYVESKKAANQQYSAFNDLKDLYDNQYTDRLDKSKIEVFIDDLKRDLTFYTVIINFDLPYSIINNKIRVILNSGNSTYSMNLMLSLFRYFDYSIDKQFDVAPMLDFINVYEIYMLYQLLGPSKRFSSRPVYDSIKKLNEHKFEEAKEYFYLTEDEKKELVRLLDSPVKDQATAKLLIAKFFWIMDAEIQDDVIDKILLNYEDSTLEHIIPQNPDAATNWLKFNLEFRNNMTYRLGNMTLLTRKKNSSAKNYGFDKKRSLYKQTRLPLTIRIGELEDLNEDFFFTRQRQIVNAILIDLKIGESFSV